MTDGRGCNRLSEPPGARAAAGRMKRARAGLAGLAVGAALFLAPVVAGADEDAASRALDGAFDVVAQARATPSLEERWTLYETADRDLREIIEMFPESDVSTRLGNSGSADGANYAEVKRALLLEAFRGMFDAGRILAVDDIDIADLVAFRNIGRLLAEVEAGG